MLDHLVTVAAEVPQAAAITLRCGVPAGSVSSPLEQALELVTMALSALSEAQR